MGIACVVAILLFDRVSKPFLLVIRASQAGIGEAAERILAKSGVKFALSSMVQNDSYMEMIYEVGLSGKKAGFTAALKELPGVTNVSLVDCRKG